jgi:NitT/TauT family transport system substrate-binding protein
LPGIRVGKQSLTALALPPRFNRSRPLSGALHAHSLAVAVSSAALAYAVAAGAQETKVAIGISGWTGFAPLTLAKEAGIFKKNGVDVTIKKIPQKDRHLAIASGDVQCAATTVETYVVWNANGVPITQVVQLDKSYGADGLAVRNGIAKIADLKGKTVGVDAPARRPTSVGVHAQEEWTVDQGRDGRDMSRSRGAGLRRRQNDAAMTYEPYLSSVRDKPDSGKIIATTLDYPMVMDTFGCTPKFIKENPKAVKAMVDSYFERST